MSFDGSEPLDAARARRVVRQIVDRGRIAFSRHARQEMARDEITFAAVLGVLRAGIPEPAEFREGSWRYRVRGRDGAVVVVALRSEEELVIVTAWRAGS